MCGGGGWGGGEGGDMYIHSVKHVHMVLSAELWGGGGGCTHTV